MKWRVLGLAAMTFARVGADARDLTVEPAKPDAPFTTIAAAVKVAAPGDTIHLTPGCYKESVTLYNKSGEPGRPITLDGHGATLDGSDPLKPDDWKMVSPGLYRNSRLLHTNPAIIGRWFFIFDGKMNHMGRTSKGPKQPFKNPDQLQPGEWTFVEDTTKPKQTAKGPADGRHMPGAFYIKIDPAKKLADYHIAAPMRSNGVAIYSRCEHLVIRNVTATHVYNDGFNIHGYSRDILFENIKAIDCGDDGISAHEDCHIRVNGFVSIGNSTGACDVQDSVSEYNRVFIRNCLAVDFYMLGAKGHTLSNSVIESSAWKCVEIDGQYAKDPICTVTMDNVLIKRLTGTNTVHLGPKSVFNGRRLTLSGVSFQTQGISATLRDSVVGQIDVAASTKWTAENNKPVPSTGLGADFSRLPVLKE